MTLASDQQGRWSLPGAQAIRERVGVSGLIEAASATLDSALDAALRTLSSLQPSVLRNPYSALRLSQVGLTVYAQSACGWRLGVGGLIDAASATLDSALDSALCTLSLSGMARSVAPTHHRTRSCDVESSAHMPVAESW